MAMAIEENVQPMTKKAKITFAVVGSLAFLVMAYGIYYWWSGRSFRALVAMTLDEGNGQALSKEERDSRNAAMGQLGKGLSKDQREHLDNIREEMFQKREMVRLNAFFAMNQKEQAASLDKEIKRDENQRKQFGQVFQQIQQKGINGLKGNNSFTFKSGNGKGQNMVINLSGANFTFGGKSSPEQKNRNASNRLDSSSPEFRLARDEYRKRIEERRQQLGLPAKAGGNQGGFTFVISTR